MADPKEDFQRLLFFALVLIVGYLTYLVLRPFLSSLAWAAVFAIMFHHVQAELSSRIGRNRAALLTTLSTGILIVAPAVWLVSILAREVPQLIEYVQQASLTAPRRIEHLWEAVRTRSPIPLPDDPAVPLREGIERVLTFLAPRAGAVVADVFATLGSLFVMLFTLFFLLRDGPTVGRHLRDLFPLPRQETDRLIRDTRDLVIASVGAGLLVAIAQGTIGGVTFWLLGINAPVIWGVVFAVCSLIPIVGAALVWVPTGIGLLLSGEITRGVILLVVGAVGISMVDNVLRPLLLSGRTSVNGLVIFLGLLGGVSAFGFIGLVIGPIIVVTAGKLLEIFRRPGLVNEPR